MSDDLTPIPADVEADLLDGGFNAWQRRYPFGDGDRIRAKRGLGYYRTEHRYVVLEVLAVPVVTDLDRPEGMFAYLSLDLRVGRVGRNDDGEPVFGISLVDSRFFEPDVG